MHRLCQDLGLRQERADRLAVPSIRHDDDIERVDERRQARRGTFQHGPSVAGGGKCDRELAGERLLARPALREDHQVHRPNHAPCGVATARPRRRRIRVPSISGWGTMGD